MRPGTSTIRPDTPLETVVKTLRGGNIINTLVTNPEGRLIGTISLEVAERKLAEPEDRSTASNWKLWSASPREEGKWM